MDRITISPDQMNGVPCVRGLRIPLATIIHMLADGMSCDEILRAYPDLEAEDIREVLTQTGGYAMPDYSKKITVYPSARTREILGDRATELNQALECWADVIARATADNADVFTPSEWCMIADVCNGTLWEPGVGNPGTMLAAEVSDGHHLDGTGYKWLADEGTELAGSLERLGAGKPTKEMRAVDAQVSSLVKRLAALDYARGWAVIVAVQWFWRNCEAEIDPRSDPWWTVAFRRKVEGAESA